MYLFSILKLIIVPPPNPLPQGEGGGEGDLLIISKR